MKSQDLRGRVALVTGASRGVGRGVATSLSSAGARVYATGRTIADSNLNPAIVRLRCDHTDDNQVSEVFDRIEKDEGRLDVLVTSAWGGYERMVEDGRFTWSAPFWEQPAWRWDAMITAGVRGAYVASQHAARYMLPSSRGLIVHLSYWAARKYLGNVLYGVSKAATDKLTADMAHELLPHGIAVVSIYPGLVRTEAVVAAGVFDLTNSESPEFVGRSVGALAQDPDVLRWTGRVVLTADLAQHYDFVDVDGRRPLPLTLESA